MKLPQGFALIFLCLCVLAIGYSSYVNTSVFPLGRMACGDFVPYVHNGIKSDQRKEIMGEIEKLWHEQISIFRQNNPDLYAKNAEKLEDIGSKPQNAFRFIFREVCDAQLGKRKAVSPVRNTYAVSKNMQLALYHKFRSQILFHREAADESCRVTMGKPASFFGITGDNIDICSDGNQSAYTVRTLKGPPKALSFCVPHFDPATKKQKEDCRIIEGTKEQQCLSTYGECKKLETGACGWAHTKESLSCAGK